MGRLDKDKVEKSGIPDYVDAVLDWEYTDGQIAALKEIISPSQGG